MGPDKGSETVEKRGTRPTLANGCSNIKRPSRPGLLVAVVAMDCERREGNAYVIVMKL